MEKEQKTDSRENELMKEEEKEQEKEKEWNEKWKRDAVVWLVLQSTLLRYRYRKDDTRLVFFG